MTKDEFVLAIERMAHKTREQSSQFAGQDGETVANAMASTLLLMIGVLRMNNESIGAVMALTDAVKGDTEQLERLAPELNKRIEQAIKSTKDG